MDELEIKITLRFKIPENGLTLNGMFYGLGKDNPNLMNHLIKAILQAFEDKAIEELKACHPGRYARNGRQNRARKFITSFGPVRYKMAQVFDKRGGKIFYPLLRRLEIIPYKQYQRETLAAPVGQAIHLSYRMAEKETARITGSAPSKSTIHHYVQELAETCGRWPYYKTRPFRFLMVDGTKVNLQGTRGESLGKKNMRWALASEGMRLQRCYWHGKRDFSFLLFQDGFKKKEQEPLRELLESIPLFWLSQHVLEHVLPQEKELVTELIEEIKVSFQRLIDALDPEYYPKARVYIENFSKNIYTVFEYWLEGKGWIPLTTNAIESIFSRIVNRNWLMLAFRKIYQPKLWDNLWEQYIGIHNRLMLNTIEATYAWI